MHLWMNLNRFVGITIKRPSEAQTESTPEAKRPRLQTNTESPKVVPQALSTATQPAVPVANPIQPPPSRPSQIIPPAAQPPPRLTHQHVVEGLRKLEERIKALELSLTTAQAEGKMEEEENILQELIKNKENYAKFKQFYLAQYMMARQQAHAHAQSHLTPSLPQNQGEFWTLP